MAMPRCNNRQLHRAFEPYLTADVTILRAGADGTVGSKSLLSQWHYRSGVSRNTAPPRTPRRNTCLGFN